MHINYCIDNMVTCSKKVKYFVEESRFMIGLFSYKLYLDHVDSTINDILLLTIDLLTL